jgi:hypothetical protein
MSEKLTPDQREKVEELMEAAQDDLEGVLFRLVGELAAMTAHRNDAEFRVSEHRRTLKAVYAELDALKAAKELAERQVALLCKRINDVDPLRDDDGVCQDCPAEYTGCGFQCAEAMAAWSRAEAKGGKG